MSGPELMRIFKKKTGEAIVKLLTEAELHQFDQQRGLNRNTFWKYSFRSLHLANSHMFWQKMNYIHQNPVKAGYVDQPEDYKWSSARLVIEGKMSDETGIAFGDVADSLGPWSEGGS